MFSTVVVSSNPMPCPLLESHIRVVTVTWYRLSSFAMAALPRPIRYLCQRRAGLRNAASLPVLLVSNQETLFDSLEQVSFIVVGKPGKDSFNGNGTAISTSLKAEVHGAFSSPCAMAGNKGGFHSLVIQHG